MICCGGVEVEEEPGPPSSMPTLDPTETPSPTSMPSVAPTMAPTQGRTRPKRNKKEKRNKKNKAQTNRMLYEEKAEGLCEEEMIIGVRMNRIHFGR